MYGDPLEDFEPESIEDEYHSVNVHKLLKRKAIIYREEESKKDEVEEE